MFGLAVFDMALPVGDWYALYDLCYSNLIYECKLPSPNDYVVLFIVFNPKPPIPIPVVLLPVNLLVFFFPLEGCFYKVKVLFKEPLPEML